MEDISEVLLRIQKVTNEGFIKLIGEDHRKAGDSREETALLSLQVVLAFGTGGSCAGSLNNICNDLDSHKDARSGTEVDNGGFQKGLGFSKIFGSALGHFNTLALIVKFSHLVLWNP